MATNSILIASELNSEFDVLGAITPNKVSIKIDNTSITKDVSGVLSAPVGSMTYAPLTTTLTYTPGDGTPAQNIDLSGLTTDIFVNGGSFNAATSVLTLTDNDGVTPDVTVDLSALIGISVDAGNVLTNGSDGKPYLSEAAVLNASEPSDDVGNLIELGTDDKHLLTCAKIKADCTNVCQSLFGTDLFFAFPV